MSPQITILRGGFAVGKINIEEQEPSIIGHNSSMFVIKAFETQSVFYAQGLCFREESHPVPSFSLPRAEVGKVALHAF
jgi:hypothetical protein